MKPFCTAHATPRISRYTAAKSASRPLPKRRFAAAVFAMALAVALMPITTHSARSNLERCIARRAVEAGVTLNVFTADPRYRASHLDAIATCSRGI